MLPYINEPEMPFWRVPGISALAKEPSQDAAAIRRISKDRTTASYKHPMVQQKVTEFYRSSDYKNTNRLLYLNGSRNYEPTNLVVCVLGKKSRDSPPAIST